MIKRLNLLLLFALCLVLTVPAHALILSKPASGQKNINQHANQSSCFISTGQHRQNMPVGLRWASGVRYITSKGIKGSDSLISSYDANGNRLTQTTATGQTEPDAGSTPLSYQYQPQSNQLNAQDDGTATKALNRL